ncbi:MAG TPA: hypothetical protein PKD26_13235 [Pyrinomonadaceae bacterium]|nr:hypothetical protein [Pyrinomonadaceae bacterium]
MKKRKSPEWFNFSLLVSKYYLEYFRYFITLNPAYPKDLRETLFPLFLEIYGSHRSGEYEAYTKDCFYQAVHLVREENDWFYFNVKQDLKAEDGEMLEKKCVAFCEAFRSFLEKYRLYNSGFSEVSNHALAHVIYFAVFIGEPNVINAGGMLQSSYPEDLLEKLWSKFPKDEWVRLFEKKLKYVLQSEELSGIDLQLLEEYKREQHVPRYLPPAENFQFFPPYDNLLGSFAEYEEKAVGAFRDHIRAYLKELKEELANHGIKRYKAEDPSQIHRLVIWNQHDFEHLWEVIEHIPEFSRVDVRNDRQVRSAVDTLRKSFTKLERFNLPVRPFGKKRKNSDRK